MDSPLFMPLDIGTIRLRHRVVMAPLTRMRSEQPGDVSGDLMAEYLLKHPGEGRPRQSASESFWPPRVVYDWARIPAGEIYPLSAQFSRDPARQRLWTGFFKRLGLKDVEPSFEIVTQQIAALVQAPAQAASQNANLSRKWSPNGPWQ